MTEVTAARVLMPAVRQFLGILASDVKCRQHLVISDAVIIIFLFLLFLFPRRFRFRFASCLAIYLQPKCHLNLNLFTFISLTPHRTKQHDNNSRNSTNMDVSADLAAHAARLSVNTGGRPSHSESSFVVP